MKTKNILKALAFAMLLTTACNKNETTVKKGYELPVTINVSRQSDDPATRATYNGSTKKLEFSTGDKLFVRGNDVSVSGAGIFAGTLDWVSEGTFSGTIITKNAYSGTFDELFTAGSAEALLLPNGYETYGFLSIGNDGTYSAYKEYDYTKTFATSKALAVEQFSDECVAYTSGTGFVLNPDNAILNFTITDLTPTTTVAVVVSDSNNDRGGNVTTDGSGTATFAVGVYNKTSNQISLTVDGTPITLNLFSGTNTALSAGHIYNITRSAAPAPSVPEGAIDGKFSVSSTKQVYFSQGNLKYSNGTWSFHTNQYDMCFNSIVDVASSYTSSGTFDLFGWGTSGFNDKHPYMTSTNDSDYYIDSSIAGTHYDWGVHNEISNGGTGWRTLTYDEWNYLLNNRTMTNGYSEKYRLAALNIAGVLVAGYIIFPDDWKSSFYSFMSTEISLYDWTTIIEAHGAVFLPALGYRNGTSLTKDSSSVFESFYWASTNRAVVRLTTGSSPVPTQNTYGWGCFVRLVKDAN